MPGFGGVGIFREKAVIAIHRLAQAPQQSQRIGPAKQGQTIFAIERKGLFKGRQCLTVTIESQQCIAMREQCVGRSGIQLDRLGKHAPRFIKSTPVEMDDAQRIEGVEIFRIPAQDFGVDSRRFGKIAQRMRPARGLQQRLAHGGNVPETAKVAGRRPR